MKFKTFNMYEASIKPDIKELERKYRAYLLDMTFFAKHLELILNTMPTPNILLDLSTGEWETELQPEWQLKIDKLMEAKNEFVKQRYPEFYE